jgi:hypothetical protein
MPPNRTLRAVDGSAQRRTPEDLEGELREHEGRLRELARQIDRELHWKEKELARAHRDIRRLHEELDRAETMLARMITPAGVITALGQHEPDEAVSATQVAARLFGCAPTHSTVVRVGQMLSRLAAEGRVRRVQASDGHRANRWAPIRKETP